MYTLQLNHAYTNLVKARIIFMSRHVQDAGYFYFKLLWIRETNHLFRNCYNVQIRYISMAVCILWTISNMRAEVFHATMFHYYIFITTRRAYTLIKTRKIWISKPMVSIFVITECWKDRKETLPAGCQDCAYDKIVCSLWRL